MHYLKIKTIVFFLLFSFGMYGQNSNPLEPKIIPPSPTAYELGRYGQMDVGMFTGTPNISVPLYTYKTKNLTIPISLGYNSNGIQVDQMETNVGLGWNLNAGGIINRVIRGLEDSRRYNPITEEVSCTDSFFTYVEANEHQDMQPDLYSYNFQGHSGQFVFDNNGKAVLVPQNNLKIERLNINNKSGFKITTEDGVEYQFIDTESSTWENVDAPETVITGWYLTKIIHPEGDVVNFTYKDSNYNFISSISESFGIKVTQELSCLSSSFQPSSYRMENHLNIMGKIIESISSPEPQFGSVSFLQMYNPNMIGNYLISGIKVFDANQNSIESADFNYFFTYNKRIFLKECIFKDPSKKYNFLYEDPEGLVARLSEQKDLWGYYNGKSGIYPDALIHKDLYPKNDLVKNALLGRSSGDKRADVNYARKGILQKIVYPTKGYNEFEYESNSVWGTVTTPCEIEGINDFFYNPDYNIQQQTKEYVFENKTEHDTEIEARVSYDDYQFTDGTFPLGELWLTVKVDNLTNPQYSITPFTVYEHNKPRKTAYTFLKNNTYRISVFFSPEAKTTGKVNFTYCKGGGIESQANIPVAGLRIAKITSFDKASNKAEVKRYYYGKKETPNQSTGVEGIPINLLTFSEQRAFCDKNPGGLPNHWNIEVKARFMNINANSIYPLYRSMGHNSTTYENVTVSNGGDTFENGGEEYTYVTSGDSRPNLCLDSFLTYGPWINESWDNGLLLKKTVFNKNLIPLQIVENKYKVEDQYTKKIPGIFIDRKYNPLAFYPSPDKKNIEHLNISKYTTNSYWFYLEEEKSTQYDLAGLNPVTTITSYKYNNPFHQKLSVQTTKNSIQETIETKYFYPSDPEMAGEPFRNELITKNMTGKVLDTQTLRQGLKLSEQKTVYDKSATTGNLLLPRYVYSNKGAAPIDINSDKKITYDQYDDKGNITQYTIESGNPVSILWGYNKTQPIAKIENATNQQIATVLGVSSVNNLNESNLNIINALRSNAAFANTMITTYTYIPLVGVSTITDPKGDKTTYTYDSFGRLEFVKDNNGNILSQNQYNYKP